MDKKLSSNLSELRDQRSITVLSEFDAHNPYGPNSMGIEAHHKIYYKFLQMKKFVHAPIEESDILLKYNVNFYGFMGAVCAISFTATWALSRFILHKRFPILHGLFSKQHVLFGGMLSAAGVWLTVDYKMDQFTRQYCNRFIEKYMDQAIKNGFEDYPISEYRGDSRTDSLIKFWTKIFGDESIADFTNYEQIGTSPLETQEGKIK